MSKSNDRAEKMLQQCEEIRQAMWEAKEAMRNLWIKVSLGQDFTNESLKKQNDLQKLWKKIPA